MTDATSTTKIELLTFRLADQEYALDIMSVREIRGWTHATPLPHAPHFMKGVINLRGTVLPVMDLALRLGLPAREQNERNVIIVVNLEDVQTGLLVNAVSDIVALSHDELQAPPQQDVNSDDNVVSALSLVEDRMIRVLNLQATVNGRQGLAA